MRRRREIPPSWKTACGSQHHPTTTILLPVDLLKHTTTTTPRDRVFVPPFQHGFHWYPYGWMDGWMDPGNLLCPVVSLTFSSLLHSNRWPDQPALAWIFLNKNGRYLIFFIFGSQFSIGLFITFPGMEGDWKGGERGEDIGGAALFQPRVH